MKVLSLVLSLLFGCWMSPMAYAFSLGMTSTKVPSGTKIPRIIQGGMGIRISSWNLAREVAREGELGVISGTVMDTVMVRALQLGDPDGAFRRALASFPDQGMVQRLLDKYYLPEGKPANAPFASLPMWSLTPQQTLLEATIVANYCEVWLAKHNDDGTPIDNQDGKVGINLLTKVQLPTIPSLYGAMLGGVDYVLMGAGIPMHIPGILDKLAAGQDCSQTIDVEGTLIEGTSPDPTLHFSPSAFWQAAGKPELHKKVTAQVQRPKFLPIVSSVVLAQSMLKRASGQGPTKGIDGFVVELNTAGGHNAPPRVRDVFNERGEPVYGPKDEVDLLKFLKAASGLPFWMAGSYGRPEKFAEVMELGGAGVQVGTAFALAKESGMRNAERQEILNHLVVGDMDVYTDPVASPTGFPFKVLNVPNTLALDEVYQARPRVCNLGYLRTMYVKPNGGLGLRCPSEPVDQYVKKGGDIEDTVGRKCLCNALCSDAGYPQITKASDGVLYTEKPLITIGDDVNSVRKFLKLDQATGQYSYSAADVVKHLVSEWESSKGANAEEDDADAGATMATATKTKTTTEMLSP